MAEDQEETTSAAEMQQQHNRQRPKRAVMSGKQRDTAQGSQADARTENGKANSRILHKTLWRGSGPNETEKRNADSARAGDTGTPSFSEFLPYRSSSRKMETLHIGGADNLSRTRSGRSILRRELRQPLRKNQATG